MLRADRISLGRTNSGVDADPAGQSAEITSQGARLGGELAGIIRRICALCGWTQATEAAGRTLAIASALEREGKSSIAQAVAIATAQDSPGDVLLLECDLLHPSLGEDFGLTSPGLSEILASEADLVDELAEGLQPTRLPNLWLLPAGSARENPSRLLRSLRMVETLTELRSRFAFIVLDLPAVLRSSDAAVLAQLSEGVAFVVRAGATDQRAVQQALQLLSGAMVHGVVLNRWQTSAPDLVRRLVAL